MSLKKIPLDQVRPGMILAQKIVRDDGVLLAQKGAAVSEPMLRMFDRMGFETVPVEVETTGPTEDRATRLVREEQELEARFSRVKDDPILTALKQALLARLRENE